MDKKEKLDIEKRAENRIYGLDWKGCYVQGALDQDPISRKKRTEEIIQIILNSHTKFINDYPHDRLTPYVEALINRMLAKVQALP